MMVARLISQMLLIAFALLMASCGRSDLSRQDAAKVIEKNSKFGEYKSNLLLQENAERQGIALGWWQMQGGAVVNLSPTIRSEGSAVKRAMFGFGNAYMVLNKPAEVSVSVTGIAGDKHEPSRVVDFDWEYKDLAPLSRRIAVQGGQGKAVFQMFDDGWRMVELPSITVSKSPYPLSEQEKQDIANDIATVRDRLVAAENLARQLLSAAKAEDGILYKVPFDFQNSAGGISLGRPRQVDILISESHVYFPLASVSMSRYAKIWFGNIKNISDEGLETVTVYISCPNFNRPDGRFLAPKEKEMRRQFISNFQSTFEKWKAKYPAYIGSQKCTMAVPVEFVK